MGSATVPLLLHVNSTFGIGGAQVRFADIANRFAGEFRHLLVAMDGNFACRERLDVGLAIEFLNPTIRKGRTIANVIAFRTLLRSLRPHTLVTYNWGAMEWAMANWPGIVRHVHVEDGFGPEEASRQLKRRVWTRRIFLSRSTLIVPSRTLERIATHIWRLNPSRVRYIPNGIDCDRFSAPHDASLAAGWPGSGPVIGSVGGLRREKNLARLLRAFRLVTAANPCRLVIVGDGPERPALEALAGELGIANRVWFAGHVKDVAPFYRGFDIVALSSDTEQMPYTVIEAMAAGLPIAATDVGDIRQMVASENVDFLASPTNERLAEVLLKLLNDPTARRRIGVANQAKAKAEFDQERMFAAHAAVLRGTEATETFHR